MDVGESLLRHFGPFWFFQPSSCTFYWTWIEKQGCCQENLCFCISSKGRPFCFGTEILNLIWWYCMNHLLQTDTFHYIRIYYYSVINVHYHVWDLRLLESNGRCMLKGNIGAKLYLISWPGCNIFTDASLDTHINVILSVITDICAVLFLKWIFIFF